MEKIRINLNIENNENVDEIIASIKNSACKELIEYLQVSDEELKERYDLFLRYLRELNEPSTEEYEYKIIRDEHGLLTDAFFVKDAYKQQFEYLNNLVYTNLDSSKIVSNDTKRFYKDNIVFFASKVKDILNIIKNGSDKKGIYLNSSKTLVRNNMFLGLSNAFLENHHQVAAIDFPSFVKDVKGDYGKRDDDLFYKVANAPVLLIDNLGNERIDLFARDDVLMPLLDDRLVNKGLITIIFSQYELEDLANLYKLQKDDMKAKKIVEKIREIEG